MPELPEVETIRRTLQDKMPTTRVITTWSHPSAKFTPAHDITGAEFKYVARRGKYLLLGTCDNRELVIHLGMTGSLVCTDHADSTKGIQAPFGPDEKHIRARWLLEVPTEGGRTRSLIFRDIRRFGRIRTVQAGDYKSIPTLAAAGPEPFDPELTPQRFHQLVSIGSTKIKTRLLSQRPIAGVGNIYADEALWMARINPRVTRLGLARSERLLDAIRSVLSKGLANGGTTLSDYRNADGGKGSNQFSLTTYGRNRLPCLRCTELLRSANLDGRTSTWCPKCQKR